MRKESAVRSKSIGRILTDNIFTLFNLINVVIAAAVFLVGAYRNMLFMGVIVCNTAIGIFQEIRSKRIIDRLSLISAPKAHLLRDGEEVVVPVSEIAVGDTMLLAAGGQLCADGVLLSGELEVDESLLTGESDTVAKHAGDKLYSGSFVAAGTGRAEAVAVGADAYANKIAAGATKPKKRRSEMMDAINKIISAISVCILPFALVLFSKALFVAGQDLQYSVTSTAAAIIGMIPEGLVLLTSIALALSSIRLARKNTLCQDLYCVENLARVDVLCLDKTGTITTGNMQVIEVVRLDKSFSADAALAAMAGALGAENQTMAAIARKFPHSGNVHCVKVEPFSSARKRSAAQFDEYGTLVLGAPSFVLGAEEYAKISGICEKYSKRGMRVLLLAQSDEALPDDKTLPKSITPRALVILTDEIRESATKTLEYFRRQGVGIRVISGDDPVTVSNVAAKAGLEHADSCVDVSTLADEELAAAAEKYTVFGRVTPARKLALVKALKAAGHKVAMTGDGVNDVLALREADCSVAVQSGSDAARCVSQLVLLDSDFSSMPLAVEEGRRCINNIQRSASLFLVKTVFSFLLSVLFLFSTSAYPFQPIQLTLISALFIGAPSFLLALEPNKSRVEGSFIANVLKKALPGGVTVFLAISTLLVLQNIFKIPQERLSVMAVYITAGVLFGVLIRICKPFRKWHVALLAAVPAAFCGACLLFGPLFYIVSLSFNEWICVAGVIAGEIAVFIGLVKLADKLCDYVLRKKAAPPKKTAESKSAGTGAAGFRSLPSPVAVAAMPRTKKIFTHAVLAVSAVYAVWLFLVLADYISVMNGGTPIFALSRPDGSNRGLLYTVTNGIFHVFGHDVVPKA